MLVGILTSVTIMGSILAGAFWLDDRHAKQEEQEKLERTFEQSQEKLERELEQTIASVDLRFLQNQLASLELTGRCKEPQFIKLCEHLRQQIEDQSKKK